MPSYLVTGANRGIGFGYLRHISNDSANTVIGIVRDKAATEKKVAEELPGRTNIHIVEAQITNYESLKKTVPQVSEITGGSIDYIIANAAATGSDIPISYFAENPEKWESETSELMQLNVTANVHLFLLYLPLLRKGQVKKVIQISSGMADIDMISRFQVTNGPIYSMTKAAANAVVAKFDAEYRKEGILFMSISPGFVQTSHKPATPEELEMYAGMIAAFKSYAPDFNGPITVDESATAVLSVIHNSSIEKGHGGAFISHKGSKQWL
ncbi:hypothetical protein B0I35DRAFT_463179 [Stachybotrys elegans]|uniref:Uncharacterized protein n=1 Tax=Stachybotrys elegans TaxID=80388 RepID=A0A8K0SJZ3_9HYPO|nr:hypothetical protein B0I35DRAFT_463179 [Stachybotrys elegans]